MICTHFCVCVCVCVCACLGVCMRMCVVPHPKFGLGCHIVEVPSSQTIRHTHINTW